MRALPLKFSLCGPEQVPRPSWRGGGAPAARAAAQHTHGILKVPLLRSPPRRAATARSRRSSRRPRAMPRRCLRRRGSGRARRGRGRRRCRRAPTGMFQEMSKRGPARKQARAVGGHVGAEGRHPHHHLPCATGRHVPVVPDVVRAQVPTGRSHKSPGCSSLIRDAVRAQARRVRPSVPHVARAEGEELELACG